MANLGPRQFSNNHSSREGTSSSHQEEIYDMERRRGNKRNFIAARMLYGGQDGERQRPDYDDEKQQKR